MRVSTALSALSVPLLALSLPTFPLGSQHNTGDRPTRTRLGSGASIGGGAALVASRQHVAPRSLVDVCAALDAKAIASLGALGAAVFGGAHAELCLCLSALPLDVHLDVKAGAIASVLGGVLNANAALEALIHSSKNKKSCTYPAHAHPICSMSDPCGYECSDGRVRSGNQCVCAPGSFECNGVCQSNSKTCGSMLPRSLSVKTFANVEGTVRVRTLLDAQATCKLGSIVCGVYNRPSAWECLDVRAELESCGGCTVPHPFLSETPSPVGTDCTSLSNVLDLGCAKSRCAVRKCREGFAPSLAGDTCVQASAAAVIKDDVKPKEDAALAAHAGVAAALVAQVSGTVESAAHAAGTVATSATAVVNAAVHANVYALDAAAVKASATVDAALHNVANAAASASATLHAHPVDATAVGTADAAVHAVSLASVPGLSDAASSINTIVPAAANLPALSSPTGPLLSASSLLNGHTLALDGASVTALLANARVSTLLDASTLINLRAFAEGTAKLDASALAVLVARLLGAGLLDGAPLAAALGSAGAHAILADPHATALLDGKVLSGLGAYAAGSAPIGVDVLASLVAHGLVNSQVLASGLVGGSAAVLALAHADADVHGHAARALELDSAAHAVAVADVLRGVRVGAVAATVDSVGAGRVPGRFLPRFRNASWSHGAGGAALEGIPEVSA